MIGVITPCLARAVVLAREGQTVIYVVPTAAATRLSSQGIEALQGDVGVASRSLNIFTIGAGSLQILQVQGRDLCVTVCCRLGLIVLHVDARSPDWRAEARALNGHRWGSMLAARADGLVPVPAWSVRASEQFTNKEF